MGNLGVTDLKAILGGEKAQTMREGHKNAEFGTSCASCDQIYSRDGALVYASHVGREIDMATSHPDQLNKLR